MESPQSVENPVESSWKVSVKVKVRSFEVDAQGIVHNAVYLHYFEIGRMEYFRALGYPLDAASINTWAKVVIARQEIDYLSPAKYDDDLIVHTRLAWIKKSSFGFEGYVERALDGKPIARNLTIMVWLDAKTDQPKPVPEIFRTLISSFEGRDVSVEASGTETGKG
ncbi:MAG: acyl-CoA thioesterase [Bacteroidota bacterium]